MAESQDSVLFKKLDAHHPHYDVWKGEWARYRDVVGDALVDKEDYLPKNNFEPQKQYEFRVQMSQFIPESGLSIERVVDALYGEKPKRDLKKHGSDLDAFVNNADRKGGSWNTVVERIAWDLLGYGCTRTLINVPQAQLPDGQKGTVTRDVEQAQGIRPYVINYSPLSVIDWEVDFDGNLIMVQVREERIIRRPEAKDPHKKAVRFLQYNRQNVTWWDFEEQENGQYKQTGTEQTKRHGLGVVPMICATLREVLPIIGHSFIRYSSRADVQKNQAESDLSYDTYMHAHPLLAIWTEDELKDIGIGTNVYLKLNPGNQGVGREDAKYIASPTSAFDALDRVIKQRIETANRHTKVDPMAVASAGESAIFQASGAARAWSFGTSEARTLSKIADCMEFIEGCVFDRVLRYGTPGDLPGPEESLFKGDIQYPEEFDPASTTQLIEETAAISQMVNSPTFIRTLHKRIAASKVGDTTAEIAKKIRKEIDSNPLIGTAVGLEGTQVFGGQMRSFGSDGVVTNDATAQGNEPRGPTDRTGR